MAKTRDDSREGGEILAATLVRPLGMSQDEWEAICTETASVWQRWVVGVPPEEERGTDEAG